MRILMIGMMAFLLLPAVATANSDETVFAYPVAAKNKKAFTQTIKHLQMQAEQIKGFTQKKQIAALRRPLVSTGIIVLSAKGICLSTRTPFSSAVKITTQGIWQQMGSRKATVKQADEHFEIRHIANILIALFTADHIVLEKRFTMFYHDAENQFQIGLRPKDRILAKIISQIVIEGTDQINRIAIREVNGDQTEIAISSEAPQELITLENCIQ
ncbi:MAG: outer membrane lipoprotein carrier protein LolA [Deltaproteobacteria bacterium]|nr:outer membrane lipoprotein carrier protein LolA [Deltaproteobacteria bacterium]